MITSTANPRVKALARLKRRSARDTTGSFPIEGMRAVQRAVAAGWPLKELIVAPELMSAPVRASISTVRPAGLAVTELGEAAFRKIAYRQHPDGVLAVGHAVDLTLQRLSLPPHPLILVAESIEKPGNLGAMLRSADGAGADAVIAADVSTDPFNPNVVRASQGSLFTVPLAVATAADTIAWLDAHAVSVLAAGPDGSTAIWDTDLTGPTALVVGGEHGGLTDLWAGRTRVALPMAGSADSLNAATTAAVLLYEAVRQRR